MAYQQYLNEMNFIKFKSHFFRTNPMSKVVIMYSIIIILSVINAVVSEDCLRINNCKCRFANGSVIDLTSIGDHHEARFKNMTPTNGENYTYFYNPCFPFSLGDGACSDVAVCQVSKGKVKEYQNCGASNNNGFFWNQKHDGLSLIYSSDSGGTRITNVSLVCSREATIPTLVVKGEQSSQSRHYEMTLTSRCACPDLCRDDHLSAGSVLVILFLIFVSLYLVLGIIHSSLTRGAHGWELIPHYEFWADFPLLVRDGCVFVMSGCKADTAYERI